MVPLENKVPLILGFPHEESRSLGFAVVPGSRKRFLADVLEFVERPCLLVIVRVARWRTGPIDWQEQFRAFRLARARQISVYIYFYLTKSVVKLLGKHLPRAFSSCARREELLGNFVLTPTK